MILLFWFVPTIMPIRFCKALEQAGIPYEFLASRGLYRQPVVLDVFAFFQAVHDHWDACQFFVY